MPTPTPAAPTVAPTVAPTAVPTATKPQPTARVTARPTQRATPKPTPRPTASPKPTPRPTVAPTASAASVVVRHGSRAGRAVALTFDMGGRVGDALRIVDWLIAHEVHATVFMTGAMADSDATEAGRQVLLLVDRHAELFSIGNHSYTHPDFRTLTAAQMRSELNRTELAMEPWCRDDPQPFFRPPYGGYDAETLATVGAAGYRWTVLWEIDTIDWRPIANDPPGPTADQIVAKVLGNAQNGSIVLMHLGGYETYAALPSVVAGLRTAGYDLVDLDELLGG